jgi:L-seryl-tRNA(Ser) seleniumtransferase
MLHTAPAEIEARAGRLAQALESHGWQVSLTGGASAVGGGSAPTVELATRLVRLARGGQSADHIEGWLRTLDPPIIARIEHDHVVLDLRTVLPSQDELLARLLT